MIHTFKNGLRIMYGSYENNFNISLIWDKSVTTQNLAFLSHQYREKRLQMHL